MLHVGRMPAQCTLNLFLTTKMNYVLQEPKRSGLLYRCSSTSLSFVGTKTSWLNVYEIKINITSVLSLHILLLNLLRNLAQKFLPTNNSIASCKLQTVPKTATISTSSNPITINKLKLLQ